MYNFIINIKPFVTMDFKASDAHNLAKTSDRGCMVRIFKEIKEKAAMGKTHCVIFVGYCGRYADPDRLFAMKILGNNGYRVIAKECDGYYLYVDWSYIPQL